MHNQTLGTTHVNTPDISSQWLMTYYFIRAAVSFVWVGAAFTLGAAIPLIAAMLLIFYPTWDAAANVLDAHRNGGLRRNPTQAINALLSLVTTISIALALSSSMNAVLGVFGVWAIVSGLLQLATAVRRWKVYGAQWLMILSGAQSALAGAFFIKQSSIPAVHSLLEVAPYAAFGAFYFLISAIWLYVSAARRLRA
ncbi:DUF308 domain-containing protein [Pseudomonas sp. efr-133-TYG-103a]|uniref:DUF308 domain-containing protein n=1 Tax=Pseudomonas sp. efr-133-TYG-103a TaxID=3040308 RepID=UPI0025527FBB|nr:DUF308 domain-containing protein [Pseudomonas sp. efr-133-TYG-103a]